MTHPQRPTVLLGVGIAVILIAACSSESLLPQPSWEIVSVEVWQKDTKDDTVLSSDSAAIDALIKILGTGEPTNDHKCGNTHTIVFHLADGGRTRFGILPGHTPGYHEYRLYEGDNYKVFRVQRESFLRALGTLGIKTDTDE